MSFQPKLFIIINQVHLKLIPHLSLSLQYHIFCFPSVVKFLYLFRNQFFINFLLPITHLRMKSYNILIKNTIGLLMIG